MPGTEVASDTLVRMLPFFAGVVAGISTVGLLVIVLAPSRRVRSEPGLDPDVETRLLLGVDPELDSPSEPDDSEDTRSDFGAAELQALRQLDSGRANKRRTRRR